MDFFASTLLVLGVGVCDPSSDWCPDPLGRAAVEQSLLETDRHSVWLNLQHYSGLSKYDYGANNLMLEYKFRLR